MADGMEKKYLELAEYLINDPTPKDYLGIFRALSPEGKMLLLNAMDIVRENIEKRIDEAKANNKRMIAEAKKECHELENERLFERIVLFPIGEA